MRNESYILKCEISIFLLRRGQFGLFLEDYFQYVPQLCLTIICGSYGPILLHFNIYYVLFNIVRRACECNIVNV